MGVNFPTNSTELNLSEDGDGAFDRIGFSLDMKVYTWGWKYFIRKDGKFKLTEKVFKKFEGEEITGRNLNSLLADIFKERFGVRYQTHRYDDKIKRDILCTYPYQTESWHFEGHVDLLPFAPYYKI
ncbi:MAG: hypothetical protein Q7S56_03320 [Nanoarchaeota archaeon]|nr:hypothetical protein [Nanoarchaeota archaeon]